MARTHPRRLAAITAVVASVMLTGATQAAATIVVRDQYSFPYSFDYSDCGFPVVVEGTASGHFSIRAGKGDRDTAFFLTDNYSFTETHTNTDTGAFLTIKGNAVFNEIKATHVEGNIFEFEAVEAGQPFAVYDSAGRLVLRDRGSLQHHTLFDTLGDNQPGGEFIADLGTDVHGPHPGFDTALCDIVTPLIGS
jgi:hypothetical protein